MLSTDTLNLRTLRGQPLLTPEEIKGALGRTTVIPDYPDEGLQALRALKQSMNWLSLAHQLRTWKPMPEVTGEHYAQAAQLEAIRLLIIGEIRALPSLQARYTPKQVMAELRGLHLLTTLNPDINDLIKLNSRYDQLTTLLPLTNAIYRKHILRTIPSRDEDRHHEVQWPIDLWLRMIRFKHLSEHQYSDPHLLTTRIPAIPELEDAFERWDPDGRPLSLWIGSPELTPEQIRAAREILTVTQKLQTTRRAGSRPPGMQPLEWALSRVKLPPIKNSEESLAHQLLMIAALVAAPEATRLYKPRADTDALRTLQWITVQIGKDAPPHLNVPLIRVRHDLERINH